MKAFMPMLLCAVLMMSAVGCTEKGDDTLKQNPAVKSQQENLSQNSAYLGINGEEVQVIGKSKVVSDGNKIIVTTDNGGGFITIQEYTYNNGVVSEIIEIFDYQDKEFAQQVYGKMINGELKASADEKYSEVKIDGNKIVAKMSEEYTQSFGDISQTDLANILGGGNISEAMSITTVQEPTINFPWEEISLPEDGMPKLAEGVSSYIDVSGDGENVILIWDVMEYKQAEGMVQSLKEWVGAEIQIYDEDEMISWNMDSGDKFVSLTFYKETYGGSIDQVQLNIANYK